MSSIKKFQEFLKEELNWGTYNNASTKLKRKGHIDRSKSLRKHAGSHHSQLSAFSEYADVNQTPFEIWDAYNKKLDVYFSGWGFMELTEEISNGAAVVMPQFIYKNSDGSWSNYPISFSIYFTNNLKVKKSTYANGKHSHTWEPTGNHGLELQTIDEEIMSDMEKGYPRFTNRRDAAKFKRLLIKDDNLKDKLEDAMDEVNREGYWNSEEDKFILRDVYSQYKKISINDLYYSSKPTGDFNKLTSYGKEELESDEWNGVYNPVYKEDQVEEPYQATPYEDAANRNRN